MVVVPTKKRYDLKQLLFDLHLWLGLASGLLVSILCLSGFFLALHPLLEEGQNRALLYPKVREKPLSVEEVMSRLNLLEGDKSYTSLEIPAEAHRSWKLREGKKASYIDPYSGENLGESRPFLGDSYRVVFRLHRWLLLDTELGRPITGAATLVFLVILLSGLLLWLQKCSRNLRRGLRFKRGVSWKRANYDAHLVLGIYAFIPLLIMAFSGLFWSYREPFKAVVYRVLDGSAPPVVEKGGKSDEDLPTLMQLPYSRLLETVATELPHPGSISIAFPIQGEDKVKITKTAVAGFLALPSRDEIKIDLRSGEVVEKRLFSDKTRAEKFLSLIKAIHIGGVWGNFSLLIYLLASLIGATLPITGTIMWWNGMRAKWRSRKLAPPRSINPPGLS